MLKLCSVYFSTGRDIYVDRYFTSHCLVCILCNLLLQNLTLIETIMANRLEVPSQFKAAKRREVESTEALHEYCDKILLLSYSPWCLVCRRRVCPQHRKIRKKHILLKMLNYLWVHYMFVYFCIWNTFVCWNFVMLQLRAKQAKIVPWVRSLSWILDSRLQCFIKFKLTVQSMDREARSVDCAVRLINQSRMFITRELNVFRYGIWKHRTSALKSSKIACWQLSTYKKLCSD